MTEPPVADTSSLVALSRAGLFDLLRVAGNIVLVPTTVIEEIEEYGPEDPTARLVRETAWLSVVQAPPMLAAVAAFRLGAGEAAVLTWALAHPGTEAILDDRGARR